MQPLWKTVCRCLRKLRLELPCDPAIPLLGIYLMCTKTLIWKEDICTPDVHYSIKLSLGICRELVPRSASDTKTHRCSSPTVSPPYLKFCIHGFNRPHIVRYYMYCLLGKKKPCRSEPYGSSNPYCSRVNWINDHVIMCVLSRVRFFVGPRTAGL